MLLSGDVQIDCWQENHKTGAVNRMTMDISWNVVNAEIKVGLDGEVELDSCVVDNL